MTAKEEIAVALLIYRNYIAKINGSLENFKRESQRVEQATFHVASLAKQMGAKDEFYAMLFKFPVMKVKIKELEKWSDENPCAALQLKKEKNSFVQNRGSMKNGKCSEKPKSKPKPQFKPKKSSKALPLKSKKKSTKKSPRLSPGV